MLSREPVARVLPSGVKATVRTTSLCPAIVRIMVPIAGPGVGAIVGSGVGVAMGVGNGVAVMIIGGAVMTIGATGGAVTTIGDAVAAGMLVAVGLIVGGAVGGAVGTAATRVATGGVPVAIAALPLRRFAIATPAVPAASASPPAPISTTRRL